MFIVWKHGFVRTGHAFIFWYVVIVAGPLLFLAHENLAAISQTRAASPANAKPRPWLQHIFSLKGLPGLLLTVELICAIGASSL